MANDISIVEQIAGKLGGRRTLAELLGVTEQAVYEWNKSGYFPALQAIKLERIAKTNWMTSLNIRAVDLVQPTPTVTSKK